jgi:glycosyltransferase involved in cell wall biosynthesis
LRIAIVSFFFPPYNTAGSLRVGKTAKYLIELGHEVRVITARGQRYPVGLDLEVPAETVTYTPWVGGGVWDHQYSAGSRSFVQKLTKLLRGKWTQLWYTCTFPDAYVGWLPFGILALNRLVQTWKPDIIIASSGPATSLLIAHYAARKAKIPWIADLRDLWADNYAENLSGRRKNAIERLERKVLSSAAGHTTVSEPLAEILSRKYSRPVAVITNAFDPDDYPANPSVPNNGGVVTISYFGSIYGKRDCTPLLRALAMLNEERAYVRFHCYGDAEVRVRRLAEQYGVAESVSAFPAVAYEDSLRLQCESDLLLMLLWNDPSQQGNFPVKLFEYVGSRRPILGIGYSGDMAASLITDSGAGVVLDKPEDIAQHLRKWIAHKREHGEIEYRPPDDTANLTRLEQTRRLSGFMQSIVSCERQTVQESCTRAQIQVPLQEE